MPKYLNTRGKSVLSIGICDRCRRKYPLGDLKPDRNYPGLRVCEKDRDEYDPWRLPPLPTERISVTYPRPDTPIGLDSVGNPLYPNDQITQEL